jgi:acetyl esterase/lipase
MERILKILIRFVIKPMLSAHVPLWLQRFAGVLSSFVLKKAPNCDEKRTTLGNRPTLHVIPKQKKSRLHVLYLHGGAYVMGGIGSHSKFATWVAHTLDAEVWLPEYHLSPEHTFPRARDEIIDCYKELIKAGVNSHDIFIAGDSAGGGLALATAVSIRDAGLPQPRSLILLSPWVDLTLSGKTLQTHVNRDHMLSLEWLQFGAQAYAGTHSTGHLGCSPLFADLAGLPPILIQVGSEEILLDDAQRLAEKAASSGVNSTLEVYSNVGHIFQVTAGYSPTADKALKAMAEFCKGSLVQSSPSNTDIDISCN